MMEMYLWAAAGILNLAFYSVAYKAGKVLGERRTVRRFRQSYQDYPLSTRDYLIGARPDLPAAYHDQDNH